MDCFCRNIHSKKLIDWHKQLSALYINEMCSNKGEIGQCLAGRTMCSAPHDRSANSPTDCAFCFNYLTNHRLFSVAVTMFGLLASEANKMAKIQIWPV